MKTTIDIPDSLYRKAKIQAIEQKKTLKDVVLHALARELEPFGQGETEPKPFGQRRKLLPSFRKAAKAGAFRPPPGARDITELISEDRDAR